MTTTTLKQKWTGPIDKRGQFLKWAKVLTNAYWVRASAGNKFYKNKAFFNLGIIRRNENK